jgi:hypothetical protein
MSRLQDPETRFTALEALLSETLATAKAMTPAYILQELPADSNGYKEIFETLSKHVGLAVAKAKLLGIANNIIKEMGTLKKKELKSDGRTLDVKAVGSVESIEELEALVSRTRKEITA